MHVNLGDAAVDRIVRGALSIMRKARSNRTKAISNQMLMKEALQILEQAYSPKYASRTAIKYETSLSRLSDLGLRNTRPERRFLFLDDPLIHIRITVVA